MTLYIYAPDEEVRKLIRAQIQSHRWTDSGFDIPMVAQNVDLSKEVWSFSFGIHVSALESGGCVPSLLLPRSSIYKSPFRLCNSIGLIDAGYRGEVKAYVDNLAPEEETTTRLEHGTRLFQLCRHNLLPWNHIELVDTLPAASDSRGSGGFGSTGNAIDMDTSLSERHSQDMKNIDIIAKHRKVMEERYEVLRQERESKIREYTGLQTEEHSRT